MGGEGNNHKLVKLVVELKDGSVSTENFSPQEARRQSIQRCIQSLVHASQCKDATCRLPSCQKMKRVLAHTKSCKKKNNGGCAICKQLIALCCYHARNCKEERCVVPYCFYIKQKLRQQEMQQRFQQQQLMKRRMQPMNATHMVGGAANPSMPQPTAPVPPSVPPAGADSGQMPATVPQPGPSPGGVPGPISGPSGPPGPTGPLSVQSQVPTGPPGQTAGPRPRGVKRSYEGDILQSPLSVSPGPTASRGLRPQVPSGGVPGMPANAQPGMPGSVANATTGVPRAPGGLPGQIVQAGGLSKGPDRTMMGPTVPQNINSSGMMLSRGPNAGSSPVNTLHPQIIDKPPNVRINQNKPVSLPDSWLNLPNQPAQLPGEIGAVTARHPGGPQNPTPGVPQGGQYER
ncbi:hypothetical protein O3P69_013878 [Scylla paramamosain]|uniref:histone acetyltransferase n=1 Tax=Scylla paramamosain TaxID=85552 RepID=A0AAW0SQU4_SCYPA